MYEYDISGRVEIRLKEYFLPLQVTVFFSDAKENSEIMEVENLLLIVLTSIYMIPTKIQWRFHWILKGANRMCVWLGFEMII